ncbi:MAG: hypothetical protein AAGD33_17520 [Actinomycetota bacterium]
MASTSSAASSATGGDVVSIDRIPRRSAGATGDVVSSVTDSIAQVPLVGSLGRTVSAAGAVAGDRGGDIVRSVGSALGAAAGTAVDVTTAGVRAATARLTDEPSGAVDDWGRDPVLVRNTMLLAQLRWDVTTGGDQVLPKRRGALIVVNSPRWALAPLFAAFAISEAVDRPVRFVGRPDDPIVGSLARRLGGLLDHPDEVAGALAADELVVMGTERTGLLGASARRVGPVDHAVIGAALATGTRVYPASTSSGPSRRSRVEIGPATRRPRTRRGPLAELELADRVRNEITALLEEMGDIATGTPFDWLPIVGMGGR